MTSEQINDATAYAEGSLFDDADDVRGYFTVANMAAMFEPGDPGLALTEAQLASMADEVIENRWHMAKGADCPRCEGTVSQQTWTSGGRTIHGGMECEACDWTETDGRPCDKCGVYVPADEYTGADRPDGTTEYLCPDCPTDYPGGE